MEKQIEPAETENILTKEQALSAYNTIQRYCDEQECKNCIFHDTNASRSFPCVMNRYDIPMKWPHIKLNEN